MCITRISHVCSNLHLTRVSGLLSNPQFSTTTITMRNDWQVSSPEIADLILMQVTEEQPFTKSFRRSSCQPRLLFFFVKHVRLIHIKKQSPAHSPGAPLNHEAPGFYSLLLLDKEFWKVIFQNRPRGKSLTAHQICCFRTHFRCCSLHLFYIHEEYEAVKWR